ncbi:hypothetical protein CPB84DRAFT_1890942 [Gymnopilus junonius]|uniref:Uncharacterized protein n=1 Tax=Gymnopilus junonius TaxID=109634 RepID=A0A9P5NUE9_GYMJU|nr:hypothetical protein CPB84DRAFT_1890942 [Gymnopilus junonius]
MPSTKRARKSFSPPGESPELPSTQISTDDPSTPPADDFENDRAELDSNARSSKDYVGRGYNALKTFKGQVYTGMPIGGSHTWNYDQGVWKETKEEPDLGAPVGTEYHWLIVAHQHVKKIDANTYETELVGSKYKLAHKNANSKTWSIPDVKSQRDREVELLEDAKRRVQGLPPVMAGEKVKVIKHEKGQQKLDSLFGLKKDGQEKVQSADATDGKKRKRGVN